MKALYNILGVWIILTGICTMIGVCEMDQFTAGLYTFCLGLMALCEGSRA